MPGTPPATPGGLSAGVPATTLGGLSAGVTATTPGVLPSAGKPIAGVLGVGATGVATPVVAGNCGKMGLVGPVAVAPGPPLVLIPNPNVLGLVTLVGAPPDPAPELSP